jgi:hypothetical protein
MAATQIESERQRATMLVHFEKRALYQRISSNHALFACITASPVAVSLVTKSVAFPPFNRGNGDDHRRKMQNARYRVQSARVVD